MSGTEITLVVDGLEVKATEGEMLVDAAKGGDVEIPVFCYEPKLGGPVGACRMCLVEIEGIPKLQTACSTPVRDGMVVYTRTDRVIEAQNAVVEFLLVNHPLDCPVCDKGGECPLQDIAMGWGPGRSRVTEPKRHFRKPIPLSPLVRIDRERCILCYRCVRFSQEVAEDEQLQLLERGASSYVGTFDDRPYIAPFHGNIIELCPVGALTSEAYRFRARPWDIEDSGSICTLCPSQCNVKFTVRDERIQRVLARDNHEVDNGWLCDKGRFGFQMISSEDRITEPRLSGNRADWDQALAAAVDKLGSGRGKVAAIVGGQASNEEAYLTQRIVRGALGSPHVTSMDELPGAALAALSAPGLSAAIAAIDDAESILLIGADPLNSMPILDLRLRKAVRHSGTRLVIASDRPTALDGGAEETARYLPGEAAAFLNELAAQLGEGPTPDRPAGEAEDVAASVGDAERIAGELRPGKTLVIWGEDIGRGRAGARPSTRSSRSPRRSTAAPRAAACCRSRMARTPAAPARPARCPASDPASRAPTPAAGSSRSSRAFSTASSTASSSSTRTRSATSPTVPAGPRRCAARAPCSRSRTSRTPRPRPRTSSSAPRPTPRRRAPSRTPTAASSACAPRSRARTSCARSGRSSPSSRPPSATRPASSSAHDALEALGAEVSFYAGLTPDEIGGTGIRWQDRPQADAPGEAGSGEGSADTPETAPPTSDPSSAAPSRATSADPSPGPADSSALRLGTYRDLWAGEVTERNEALRFLAPEQRVEVAPADAERLGIFDGDSVAVRSNGHSVRARVVLRERMRPGAAFLIEGTATDNANALNGADVVEIEKLPAEELAE